ncbi:MAG: recombinase RecT [Prevotella sp.]|nr:recombinase RecT [Candidatus Prevotella equi]
MADVKQSSKNVGDLVLSRIDDMSKVGLCLPEGYNVTNAVKASLLTLQEVKDKDGKPALDVCTTASIQSALFEMCLRGLSVADKSCYMVVRGNKLCMTPSYFGRVKEARRIYPQWNPRAVVVREGDEFLFEVDPATGEKKLVKHEQKLENLDNDFVGAYLYAPTLDGSHNELHIMTKRQILAAWSKSSSKTQSVHKQFEERMVQKTIINSVCNMLVNSHPENSRFADNSDDPNAPESTDEIADYEEVVDAPEALPEAPVNVDAETGEIKNDPAPEAPAQAQTQNNDSDF